MTLLNIPDEVESIFFKQYAGDSELRKVLFGKNVQYVAPLAFSGCTALNEISVNEKIIQLAKNAFDNTATGGAEKILLKSDAYRKSSGILFNARYNSVLFAADSSLAKIEFPKNTKYIGAWAFKDCAALSSAEIPPTVEWIGERAFEGCTALERITLTKSVKAIDSAAFLNCKALKEFKIPKGISVIEEMTFGGCSALERVEIPSSVKLIKLSAFEFCTSLEKVIIPKWCQVEEGAFPKKTLLHRI